MLRCTILGAEAYFHRMCTSETVPSPQPSPFISHPPLLAPMSVFNKPHIFPSSPTSPTPRCFHYSSPRLHITCCIFICGKAGFTFFKLDPFMSTSDQPLVITPSVTQTHFITLPFSVFSPSFLLNLRGTLSHLSFIYISWFTSAWPAHGELTILQSCVLMCRCVSPKRLSSILLTHPGTYTCIVVPAFLSCDTHTPLPGSA